MTYRELIFSHCKNLDAEVDFSEFTDTNKNKSFIYISGHRNLKVFIEGDTCYELSEILPGQFELNDAKRIVDMLYSDKEWRLPTIEELELIYDSKIIKIDNRTYWSSSPYNNNVWKFNFNGGNRVYHLENGLAYVRAIRSFKIKNNEEDDCK